MTTALAALLVAGQMFGTPGTYTGPICARAEDTARLVRTLVVNAQVITSRADILALAEREGLRCQFAYGLRVIFAGTVPSMAFMLGKTGYEIVRFAVGSNDAYGWRVAETPGVLT